MVASNTPISRTEKTRQKILSAALQEFSAKGYSGATTRGIADIAGVSELTLFRHYASKKNLFLAMISQFSALPVLHGMTAGEMSGEPRHDLTVIGSRILSIFIQRRSQILMTLREAEHLPELHDVTDQFSHQQTLVLAEYIRRQMDQENLRKMDPVLAAQSFLGMLFSYSIYRGHQEISNAELETEVAHYVDIFLDGVAQTRKAENHA